MPKTVAVTHADLAPKRPSTELGSRTCVRVMVLTILCGLFCFILCLIAEATRSQESWVDSDGNGKEVKLLHECVYSGSGKTPLLCSVIAFVGLAIVMVVLHMYMLVAVTKSSLPALMSSWDPDFTRAKNFIWQAGFFFVAIWLCFAMAEILSLIGLSVESGHLKNWSKPREKCLIIKEGLYCAAGVFSLITVFLSAGLYLTALHAQKMLQEEQNVQQQVIETSILFATPPASPPPHRMTTMASEDPGTVNGNIPNPTATIVFVLMGFHQATKSCFGVVAN